MKFIENVKTLIAKKFKYTPADVLAYKCRHDPYLRTYKYSELMHRVSKLDYNKTTFRRIVDVCAVLDIELISIDLETSTYQINDNIIIGYNGNFETMIANVEQIKTLIEFRYERGVLEYNGEFIRWWRVII